MVFTRHSHGGSIVLKRLVLGVGALCVMALIWHFRYVGDGPNDPCTRACSMTAYSDVSVPEEYIALTFDDGPVPLYTEEILAVLKKHNAPATFFLLGQNAVKEPDLVKRIYAEGHEIGNHTFTHDLEVQATRERLVWELDQTNKVIESLTGRSAILYRPPYLLDLEPYEVVPDPESLPVWGWVYDAGYLPIGSDLDSDDWQAANDKEALDDITAALDIKTHNPSLVPRRVFLFHDSPQTAHALDRALTMFEERGYRVVPLGTLLGYTREEVMPVAARSPAHSATELATYGLALLLPTLAVLVIFITVATTMRFVVFLTYRLRYRRKVRHEAAHPLPRFSGTVSVLIPAFNEGENVRATILSTLANTRRPDEIIVIDDGSNDDTLARAREVEAMYPNVVRVLTKENGGKASALNVGVAAATGEVVVAIDGDTVLDPLCVDAITRPFLDPGVGATAGKIVPANAHTLMEKYQYLEYLVGQNVDKVVISALGAVNVVPGAVGAWRREAVIRAGGYSTDTLVEDQDLTLAVLGLKYRVVYVPNAVAFTEVPTTVRAFYLQRFRWSYGTFQCIYKYKGYVLRQDMLRLGWVALPYAMVFNVVLPLVTLALNITILLGAFLEIMYPAYWFLLAYTVLDIIYAYVALLDEDRYIRRFVMHMPLQRFAYLMAYSVIIFLVSVKVLDGSPTRWNKLKRTGSAELYFRETLSRTIPANAVPDIQAVRVLQ